MYSVLIALNCLLNLGDIYQFTIPGIAGSPAIHFSDFKGRKILLVNTASGSMYTTQYARLELLYQQYKDKLVIIAVPSNDFQHEPGAEPDIRDRVAATYHPHYLLAGKAVVSGPGSCDLYKWLTDGTQSGAMSSIVSNDFQKYLVGTDGRLIGYFNGAADPMDQALQNLIAAP